MDQQKIMYSNTETSRVQRAFSNAAFFWLDRNEFPLNDFLHACTTHFLLRPDFTSGDAEFILKWIEQQRRNPKSTLNKTLRQQVKFGIETKDLQVVKASLKAFITKPKITKTSTVKVKAKAKVSPVKKAASTPSKKVKVKALKKVAKKVVKVKKLNKKVSAKKVLKSRNGKILKTAKTKISLLKKAKSLVKNAAFKNKNKKRRAA